jgi:Uri superfamily endonuclease
MKGIYVLIVSIVENINVNVGALGSVTFEKGLYAYVGSAQNNLEKRIQRHLRKTKQKFWHIDYLLENDSVKVLTAFYRREGRPKECDVARKIAELGVPIRGFGSSDCRCRGHLFRIDSCTSFIKLAPGTEQWVLFGSQGASVVSKANLYHSLLAFINRFMMLYSCSFVGCDDQFCERVGAFG